ncbi:response regulator transcription factor [Pseudobutyrivibrio sp.]|uniref:response regulator transcription factor n=1 Tax=Pseudobutyrivibrio sp. TaxID=2014367 RepID=UPI001DD7129B|nr:response regulator [Pseudobutyrivibrio sp.]MBE5910140.1 response regulator [Pseudobutyrivibrio sp.]
MIEETKLSAECKYQVLVADDEPAAAQMIEKIVNTRSNDFYVKGIALNGQEALDFVANNYVDLIISDVRMPMVDGISLVTRLQENRPEIESIIVSGYQDFEYVQGALRADASDYILKPITPTKIMEALEKVNKKIDKAYYQRRNKYLKMMVKGHKCAEIADFNRVFWSDNYYVAVARKNGLITRFRGGANREIFSEQQEQMIIYGRDEQEMLFIYPQELVYTDYDSMMNRQYNKMLEDNSFLTMVVCEEPVATCDLADYVYRIYQTMDRAIIIGKNQKLGLCDNVVKEETNEVSKEKKKLLLEISTNNLSRLNTEIKSLVDVLGKQEFTQLYVESTIRHILYELKNNDMLTNWDEHWLDDIFCDVISMDDLANNVIDIIDNNLKKTNSNTCCDKKSLYEDIVGYMEKHLKDDLSVQNVCKAKGISQATLNRLFRQYGDDSYKGFLTKLRIQEAVKILEDVPSMSIKDVAMQVGFNDQFYFSRVFKTIIGKNPSEYTG